MRVQSFIRISFPLSPASFRHRLTYRTDSLRMGSGLVILAAIAVGASAFVSEAGEIKLTPETIAEAAATIRDHPFFEAEGSKIDTLRVLLVHDEYLTHYTHEPIALVRAQVLDMEEATGKLAKVGSSAGTVITLKIDKVLCSALPEVQPGVLVKSLYYASVPGNPSFIYAIGPKGCESSTDSGQSRQVLFPQAIAYLTIRVGYQKGHFEPFGDVRTTAIRHFVISDGASGDILDREVIERILEARLCSLSE